MTNQSRGRSIQNRNRIAALVARVFGGRRTYRPAQSPPCLEPLESRVLLSVGGGFTNAGVYGEYFNNTTLSASPTFARQDVRVDFDWGTTAAPGGSTSAVYSGLGTSNYSVRWTGQVIAAFSENYTFKTTSAGGVRLYVKPAGTTNWNLVVDDWSTHATKVDTGNFAMTAGATYDIKMEYYQTTGSAVAKLHWQSASTPEEVVEPVSLAGINAVTYNAATYADAIKMGRDEWASASAGQPYGALVQRDANGWPMGDASNIVWEGASASSVAGTYTLQFTGKAAVTAQTFGGTSFVVNGVTYNTTLPAGVGYDAASNTTTATLNISANNAGIMYLTFLNSQRTAASATNTGVTNVKLMRPTSPGASTSYPLGTVFDAALEQSYAKFTTERWLTANFDTAQVNWSDRKRPGYSTANFSDRNEVWEYEVMLANETGKDLYITVPMNASADYVTKLANLIKYGSDGVNPYTSAQANPVYPGLNSNLRLYVEWANEIWNWSFSQAGAGYDAAKQAVANNTPDGQIINYDGQAGGGDFRRWTALKTVQASDAFRNVWGTTAMGDRVRVLLEYQYDDYQGTASSEFAFLDNYFNNADGTHHVATPHPVSYYIWGGGGAVYFGAPNSQGYDDSITVGDSGFELPVAAPGTTLSAPAGTPWVFTGNAGIYSDNTDSPAASSQSLGAVQSGSYSAVGYKFTVGSSPINVYQLGRWAVAGNSQTHEIHIFRASDMVDVANVTVNLAGATPGQYVYTSLGRPATLDANTTYYIVSTEGGDAYYDQATTLNAAAGITINNAVTVTGGGGGQGNYSNAAAGNHGLGPVNFTFTTNQVGALGAPPDAPQGNQAAYIGDTATITTTINFTSTGVFALDFFAANKLNKENGIRLYVDGVEVTPDGNNYTAFNGPWTPGAQGWGRTPAVYYEWGSAPFNITTTGNHTIKIVGTGAVGTYTYIDSMRITSTNAIFDSGMPGNGEANGQPQAAMAAYQSQLDSQAKYAQAYGLKVVAYEGGWSLGGDNGGSPIQNYAKYADPRAGQATTTSIDDFARSGGSLYMVGTYYAWPGTGPTGYWPSGNSVGFPIPQGVDAANQTLPPDPTNGTVVPGGLSVANPTWSLNLSEGRINPSGWIDWNILVPNTGSYDLGVATTGGGNLRISIDEATTMFAGASGGQFTGAVTLTKGLHTLKIQNTGGVFVVTSAAMAVHNTPLPPGGLTVTLQNSLTSAKLSWGGTTPNQTGYNLYRATDPAFTQNLVTTHLALGVTTYTDPNIDPSKTYYYIIRATVPNGESVNSNTVTLPALVSVVASDITDSSFEIPALAAGGFQFRPSSSPWIIQGNAGIQSNASAWGAANAPAGTQTAFLQSNGSLGAVNQVLSLPAGTYQLNLMAARRAGQLQPLRFSVDGVQVGSLINPTGNNFSLFTTASFTLAAGVHTLRLEATDNSSDLTSFIDSVNLVSSNAPPSSPPTVANAASASTNPVTGTSVNLFVLGADDGGEAGLTYSWAATGNPPAGVTFSINASNTAKSTTATFSKAGAYTLQATILDAGGQSVTSSVNVTVNQTLTSITVSPTGIALSGGDTQQFTALAKDQFANALSVQPALTWSVNPGGAGGTINPAGLYTAPSGVNGADTVKAASGSISGTATLSVAGVVLANGGFESPSLGAAQWKFAPANASWVFSGNAGIQSNASAWGAANAPAGTQTAFLQSNGSLGAVNQVLSLPAGTYQLNLMAARRAGQLQPLRFSVDGVQVGSLINPTGNNFSLFTTASFTLAAGVHTLRLEATDNSSDLTSFIDSVNLVSSNAPPSSPPTVANAASASTNPVTGTSVNLFVLGADDGGEAGLTYSWAATGNPPAGVTFSINASNTAKSTTATFSKAGAYTLQATILDAGGQSVTSSVNVTVNQTLTSITVSPTGIALSGGDTQQFTALAKDQFANALSVQPALTWSVNPGGAGGTINPAGLYTAPSGVNGADTVKAASGSISGTATLSVAGVVLANGGFESPSLGAAQWKFAPANASWVFSGNAGIQSNASAWGAANAPAGTQTAFLQSNGSLGAVNQVLSLPAGTYQLNLMAARRAGQLQPLRFSVDGVQVGSLINPTGNNFSLFTTASFTLAAGVHTLRLEATDNSSDLTSFIDSVNLVSSNAPPSSPPTVANAASASTNPVTGTSVNLFVLGADDGGEAGLTYSWAATGNPPAGVTFSINASNTAKSTTATFSKAGAYTLQATILDAGGQSVTSSVNVTVNQTLTSITVSPTGIALSGGDTQQFTALAKDQFANALSVQPALTWSVNPGGAGGTINPAGLYTAPSGVNGADTVKAASGSISGTATLSVAGVVLANGGFESPSLGAAQWKFAPANASWVFSGNAGIQSNASAWGAANAPAGTQTAFLQSNGSLGAVNQVLSLPAGTYQLNLMAARRAGQLQPLRFSVDGVQVGSLINPTGNNFSLFTTASFTLAAGVHTLRLEATDNSSDLTSFIDSVNLVSL